MSRIGFNHSRRFESAQSKVLTLLKLIVSALIPGEKGKGGGKGEGGREGRGVKDKGREEEREEREERVAEKGKEKKNIHRVC